MAFNDANILIFTGKDCARFLDGLSSNMIDFQSHSVIDTLVLSNRAKIIAQLHLFMLNDMLISITICEDLDGLKNFLNSKILSQDVIINDVSELNHVDIVYDEALNDESVVTLSETTIVKINETSPTRERERQKDYTRKHKEQVRENKRKRNPHICKKCAC